MQRIRSMFIVAAATAALAGGCGPAHKHTADPDKRAARTGAALVTVPVADESVISYSVWFPVGSHNDPPGKEGLAWLTGQLLADGGTTENSYQQIVSQLYPMAASYSVRVDREMTTLSGRAHRDHSSAFQKLFSDAYGKPLFANADFERLRNQGLSYLEKRLRYASDEELGKAALYEFVFAGTSYRHPVTGTVAGLRAITLDDVKAFYRRYYTRERAVFAIGGGYDQATVDSFQATRAQLPSGAEPAAAVPEAPAVSGRHVTLVSKPGADASISMGFPIAVKRGEKDFYALWIATSWLGEHRNSSSHLYQVIRQTRGLNYGDYAYIESFPEGGRRQKPPVNVGRSRQLFEIWIRTLPNDKAVFALRAALRELRLLVDEGMTREEFETTRTFLRKYIRHFAPTTQARLGYALDDRFYGLEDSHIERFVRMMDELTLDDVNTAIRKHLQVRDMKIAIVTGDAEGLKQALVSGAPSAIEYPVPKPQAVLDEDKLIVVEKLDITADRVRVTPVEQMFAR
jgi:zinc protease